MKLLSKNDVNIKRQFEFDLAKAICILGMVFVHCFEEFPLTESGYGGSLYYILIIVLDALFGAGTFMTCMGIGITYSKNKEPNAFIKRGFHIFILGYVLNVLRYVIPFSGYLLSGEIIATLKYLINCFLYTDILQFAGLALMLFGLLKKIKVPDIAIGIIAIAMSLIGSFVRFINVDNIYLNEIIGLFVGTIDPNAMYFYYAPFALLNWFIIVVFGYFYGKLIRRVNNIEKFYAITTPISAIILITYMAIAIPNKYGMMSGEEMYYFQMTTWESLIIMTGAVFAFGLYHFISKLFNDKVKSFITGLSININKTYCIHWIIIGFAEFILWYLCADGLPIYIVVIISTVIYIVSSLLAEVIRRKQEKKKALKQTIKAEN